MKICFPVCSDEGINSIPFGHFGTAPMFIIVDSNTKDIKVVKNGDLGHQHGMCQPLKALSGESVDVVIVGGIGQGAISKLNDRGINVFKAVPGSIKENLESFNDGKLESFDINHTCSHDGCDHH